MSARRDLVILIIVFMHRLFIDLIRMWMRVFDDFEVSNGHFQLFFSFPFNMNLFTSILMHNELIIIAAIIISLRNDLTGPPWGLQTLSLTSFNLRITFIQVAIPTRRCIQVLEYLLREMWQAAYFDGGLNVFHDVFIIWVVLLKLLLEWAQLFEFTELVLDVLDDLLELSVFV